MGAAVIETFWETSPGNNVPPKVKTTAWVTYDDRYFYIAVKCDDPDPRKIRAPYVDRDNVIGTDDNVAIFLDTRNDRRSAVEIRVNPRGIQGDAMFNDANGNEDFSPDFFYDTAARITAEGWQAEVRIPFSTLRYPKADPQTWGVLLWRNYPREYRYFIHSSPVPRGSNCIICRSRELTGLTGLPSASTSSRPRTLLRRSRACPATRPTRRPDRERAHGARCGIRREVDAEREPRGRRDGQPRHSRRWRPTSRRSL